MTLNVQIRYVTNRKEKEMENLEPNAKAEQILELRKLEAQTSEVHKIIT